MAARGHAIATITAMKMEAPDHGPNAGRGSPDWASNGKIKQVGGRRTPGGNGLTARRPRAAATRLR
ncbi:hypothetical protein GCM10017687_88030 [Streptomyces echinatus]